MLIPSIDLMNGKAVQLVQGKKKVIERDDVFELLKEFSLYGEVAIIDLDAALNQGDNKNLIKQLLKVRPCRVGGGIRDLDTALEYIKAGASKIIIGTKCCEEWTRKIAKECLIFAIDAKGDFWSTAGWKNTEQIKIAELIPQLESRCSEFLYTQIEKEGLLQGLDRNRIKQVIQLSTIPVTIAGGISTLDDVHWFTQLGANGQIGMSIYTGQLSLEDCFTAQLDFAKQPLIPTIVQDYQSNKVLMLAYSSPESLAQAIRLRKGIYWSRSRNQIWHKGLTSGNQQELVQIDTDCDGDTLLFKVKMTGVACHLERYSCFASERNDFSLQRLQSLLQQRLQDLPENSFSSKLFQSDSLRAAKIREEAEELIEAKSFNEVQWEAADLLFFTVTDALAKGVEIQDIMCELRSRFNDQTSSRV